MKQLVFLAMVGLTLTLQSCIDLSDYDDIGVAGGQQIAIPIIDTDLSISKVNDALENSNSQISIDPTGRITFFYNGEVLRNGAKDLFPAYPGLLDYPLLDTNVVVPLPLDPKYNIDRAIFGNTNMFFRFITPDEGNYTVKVTIPQIETSNGAWTKTYQLNYTGNKEYLTTQDFLAGRVVTPLDGGIQFIYEAVNSQGQRVKLPYAAMKVDVLEFSYVEGFFNKHIFDIQGQNIGVGFFEAWESGGMNFANPKMNIDVDNSFGFPVRSKVNKVTLVTKEGGSFDLESEFIDKGIDFGYPFINEVGVVKSTSFDFNKDNSNIRELFNDKVVRVDYDIDAVANPDVDESIINFVDSSSFFKVKVSIELPLEGEAKDFTVQRTADINLSQLDQVSEANVKLIVDNGFPIDIKVQGVFYDDSGVELVRLFEDGPQLMAAGNLSPDGIVTSATLETIEEKVEADKMALIAKATKMKALITFTNPSDFKGQKLWIYDDYNIGIKLGINAKRK